MSNLPEFFRLFYQAFESADLADRFDLNSAKPESARQYATLRAKEAHDQLALIDFITRNGKEVTEYYRQVATAAMKVTSEEGANGASTERG